MTSTPTVGAARLIAAGRVAEMRLDDESPDLVDAFNAGWWACLRRLEHVLPANRRTKALLWLLVPVGGKKP